MEDTEIGKKSLSHREFLVGTAALTGQSSKILKRVPTGYVVIDKTNVNDPASQAAIYKSS